MQNINRCSCLDQLTKKYETSNKYKDCVSKYCLPKKFQNYDCKFLFVINTLIKSPEAVSDSALVNELKEGEVELEDYHSSNINPSNGNEELHYENSTQNTTGMFETVI